LRVPLAERVSTTAQSRGRARWHEGNETVSASDGEAG